MTATRAPPPPGCGLRRSARTPACMRVPAVLAAPLAILLPIFLDAVGVPDIMIQQALPPGRVAILAFRVFGGEKPGGAKAPHRASRRVTRRVLPYPPQTWRRGLLPVDRMSTCTTARKHGSISCSVCGVAGRLVPHRRAAPFERSGLGNYAIRYQDAVLVRIRDMDGLSRGCHEFTPAPTPLNLNTPDAQPVAWGAERLRR